MVYEKIYFEAYINNKFSCLGNASDIQIFLTVCVVKTHSLFSKIGEYQSHNKIDLYWKNSNVALLSQI